MDKDSELFCLTPPSEEKDKSFSFEDFEDLHASSDAKDEKEEEGKHTQENEDVDRGLKEDWSSGPSLESSKETNDSSGESEVAEKLPTNDPLLSSLNPKEARNVAEEVQDNVITPKNSTEEVDVSIDDIAKTFIMNLTPFPNLGLDDIEYDEENSQNKHATSPTAHISDVERKAEEEEEEEENQHPGVEVTFNDEEEEEIEEKVGRWTFAKVRASQPFLAYF